MFEPAGQIRIVDVPSGEKEDRIARQEFVGLTLPTVTPNGQASGYYSVYLVDALPIINTERPLLATWLENEYPAEDGRASARLVFEAAVCQEVEGSFQKEAQV